MKECARFVSHEPVPGLDGDQAKLVAELRVDAMRHLQKEFANHGDGFRRLQAYVYQHFAGRVWVGLEAIGRPERSPTVCIAKVIYVLNRARVAAYAPFTWQRNKTDPARRADCALRFTGTPQTPTRY